MFVFQRRRLSRPSRVISPKCVRAARDDITRVSGVFTRFLSFASRPFSSTFGARKNAAAPMIEERRYNGRWRRDGEGRLGGVTNACGRQVNNSSGCQPCDNYNIYTVMRLPSSSAVNNLKIYAMRSTLDFAFPAPIIEFRFGISSMIFRMVRLDIGLDENIRTTWRKVKVVRRGAMVGE